MNVATATAVDYRRSRFAARGSVLGSDRGGSTAHSPWRVTPMEEGKPDDEALSYGHQPSSSENSDAKWDDLILAAFQDAYSADVSSSLSRLTEKMDPQIGCTARIQFDQSKERIANYFEHAAKMLASTRTLGCSALLENRQMANVALLVHERQLVEPNFQWKCALEIPWDIRNLTPRQSARSQGWHAHAGTIIRKLARLKEDWAGPGSVRPSPLVIAAVERVASYLPGSTRMPEVEVDDSTGEVTLLWWAEDLSSSFSLVFPDGNTVLGVSSALDGKYPPIWRFSIAEERHLERHLVGALEAEFSSRLLAGA